MKICFDARCLEEENISGVGEYALELLKNILESDKKNHFIVFSNSFKQKNNRHFDWIKKYSNAELKRFSIPNKILNFCFWYLNWPKIDWLIGGADVFFAPNINFLALGSDCELSVTFHDLSFEKVPYFFALKTRLWHRYFVNPRKIARIAKNLIAVSESTKNDLINIYGIDSSKISIIQHGVSNDFRIIDRNDRTALRIKKKYNLPDKFILFLGNIEARKNILGIIEAYKILISRNPDFSEYELVLTGNINGGCRDIITKEKIKTCGYIERADRPYVYNLATLFVYPSFFEGFGLPVLEAMACGTPSVVSNNTSLPQVAGCSAILIDPNRPVEVAEAMQSLLGNRKFYDTMKDKGVKHSKKFDWAQCAQETLAYISNKNK